jgi:hypothetical protein
MEKKKLPQEFEITELFLVKAGNDYSRTFVGQIYRETNKEGISILRGNVMVNDGKIWSSAGTQEELGKYLDGLCVMKLDLELHSHTGVTTKVLDTDFFLN